MQINQGYLITECTLLIYFDKPNLLLITRPPSTLVNVAIVTLAEEEKSV